MRSFIEYVQESSNIIDIKAVRAGFEKALSKFATKEGTPGEIAKSVRSLGKKYLFDVSLRKVPALDSGSISVWGFYDPSVDQSYVVDEAADYPIELVLLFSTHDSKLALTKSGVSDFARYLTETLAHEWIHLAQARSRNWKDTKTKDKYLYKVEDKEVGSYLGKDDEIEAHAFNIAGSILDTYGDKAAGIKFLNKPKPGALSDHHFDMYIATYGGHDHPVIKRLYKKIISFMDRRK